MIKEKMFLDYMTLEQIQQLPHLSTVRKKEAN